MTSTVVYATLDELKAQPEITFTKNDVFYTTLLSVASRALDMAARRRRDGFVASGTPTARRFQGRGTYHLWIGEAVNITKVEMSTSIPITFGEVGTSYWYGFSGSSFEPDVDNPPYHGIILLPDNGFLNVFPTFTGPYLGVRVTADWGYASVVPPQVKQATIALAMRWIKRGQSFWAEDAGAEQFGAQQFAKVDPDIKKMLTGLIRTPYGG